MALGYLVSIMNHYGHKGARMKQSRIDVESDVELTQLEKCYWELAGVLQDVDRVGVDKVCKETIWRVMHIIGTLNKEQKNNDTSSVDSNWRAIVEEAEPLLGRLFIGEEGAAYRFIGVLHAEYAYYYCMMGMDGRFIRVSCVGGLVEHGYTLMTEDRISE